MILTASEAAKLIPGNSNKSTEDICDEIKTLAEQGWESALWELDKDQIKEFEDLGYSVLQIPGGNIYKITWKQKR